MHYELTKCLGAALAVDGARHYATSVASTLPTGVEAFHVDVVQSLAIAGDAQGRRSAGLYTNDYRLVGQESFCLTAKKFEGFGQAMADELWQPLV